MGETHAAQHRGLGLAPRGALGHLVPRPGAQMVLQLGRTPDALDEEPAAAHLLAHTPTGDWKAIS